MADEVPLIKSNSTVEVPEYFEVAVLNFIYIIEKVVDTCMLLIDI